MDSHVNYLHRDALVVLRGEFYSRGARGEHPVFVGNGFGGFFDNSSMENGTAGRNSKSDIYPELGFKWPKSRWRRFWTWALRWNVIGAQNNVPAPKDIRWWQTLLYYVYHRYIIEYNFSDQDNSVMNNQSYNSPEALSITDSEVVQWRRFIVTKHFGGRNAKYEFKNPGNLSPEEIPMEMVSGVMSSRAKK